jgi:hypothetical protein
MRLAQRFQLLASNFDRHPHVAEKGVRLDHPWVQSVKSRADSFGDLIAGYCVNGPGSLGSHSISYQRS